VAASHPEHPQYLKMNQSRIPDWLFKSIWLAVLLLLYLAYFLLNSARGNVHSLELTVDDRIPLAPGFVFPYLSLYALLIVSVWRFLRAETKVFTVAALAIGLDLVLSYLVFFFYQTRVERPVILGSDVSSDILRWVYSLDKPFNAFPSLHTSTSMLLVLLWRRVGSHIQPIIALWAALIIASTLLTKQHYIADLLGGITVALVSYYVAVKLGNLTASSVLKSFTFWRKRSQ
jgi:membrane-associated phospholipid phosphatase